jgi:hypothetical protein
MKKLNIFLRWSTVGRAYFVDADGHLLTNFSQSDLARMALLLNEAACDVALKKALQTG